MDIRYYSIISPIGNTENEEKSAKFLEEIEEALGQPMLSISDPAELAQEELCFIYVRSGGTEQIFEKLYPQVEGKVCYLITTGFGNSLAAALEILSFFKQKGQKGEVLHGTPEELANRMKALAQANHGLKKMKGARFGVVGTPSDWLISSAVDEAALFEKLNASVISIPMEECIAEIEKKSYIPNEWTQKILKQDFPLEEIKKALFVYGGLHRLVEKYDLTGVTVRCFDLLDTVKSTGCLALAILNAEGIFAACEGDVPSLISMAILGSVSGNPVFMCNPCRINFEKNHMIFAHCTLPLNMAYQFTLDTHYESGIGVAIAGSIREGENTVFKTSGDLSRYYVRKGILTSNLRDPNLCRSQIRIKLDDYSYFMENPISNHHLVCNGDQTLAIQYFFEILG